MAKPLAQLLIALTLVSGPACGRKGPLELPPGRAPLPVEGLTAYPVDGSVVLEWLNPAKAVSGRPLGPLKAVEIWVFDEAPPAGSPALDPVAVERMARLAGKIPRTEIDAQTAASAGPGRAMTWTYAVEPSPGAGPPARLAFTVRVVDRAGRASDFAPPVVVEMPRRDGRVDPGTREGVS